jgi:hypothetical protein
MISIKKYLDMVAKPAAAGSAASGDSNGIVAALVQSYRSTIDSMANNGARACPAVGSELRQGLAESQRHLTKLSLRPSHWKSRRSYLSSWINGADEPPNISKGKLAKLKNC